MNTNELNKEIQRLEMNLIHAKQTGNFNTMIEINERINQLECKKLLLN